MATPSFWKSNPMVPSWTEHWKSWWNSYPPRMLTTQNIHIPIRSLPGLTLRKGTPTDAQSLSEFWERWYTISSKSRCCIPATIIRDNIQKNRWDIWILTRNDTHTLVGSIIRRVIKGLHIQKAVWPTAGVVDFFCIHPAWRKKGLGHQLLASIQNSHTTVPPPHLILWEGLRVDIPPLSIGALWMKRCVSQGVAARIVKGQEAVDAWRNCTAKMTIWSDYTESSEVLIWSVKSGNVITWNTFHRSIPDGSPIEIILAYSSKEAVDEYTKSFQGVLLSDTWFDGWTFDSPFQWIAYNLNPGSIQTRFPCISF